MKRIIGLDVETSSLPFIHPWQSQAYLVAVGIVDEWGYKKTWVFNHDEAPCDVVQRVMIKHIQEEIDKSYRIVGHNLKFDLNWLRAIGIDFTKQKLFCTAHADYLINGQAKISYQLSDVSVRYRIPEKIDKVKMFWDAGYETRQIPLKILLPYLEQDCLNALAIYQRQVTILKEKGMVNLNYIQTEVMRVLSEIECTGMYSDKECAVKYVQEYSEKLTEIDFNLMDAFGWKVNLNSGDQLSAALFGGTIKRDGKEGYLTTKNVVYKEPYIFEYADGRTTPKTRNKTLKMFVWKTRKCIDDIPIEGIGFKPPRGSELKKEGYFSTDKGTIKQLKGRKRVQKDVIKLLLERSGVKKVLETFIGKNDDGIKGLVNKIQKDGCIHPQYNQSVTSTGRLSSKDPEIIVGVYKLCEFREHPNVKAWAILSETYTISTQKGVHDGRC